MSTSIEQGWTVQTVGFQQVPVIGAGSVLRRLDEPAVRSAMPLLDVNDPRPSTSPFHDAPELARTLEDFHGALGFDLDETVSRQIQAGASFVIAGQQPGLMLGPMFTMFKAVTAIGLARRFSAAGRAVVPAFWMAGEDHDVTEVNRCTIGEQKLVIDHPEAHMAGVRPPVARISLEPWREQIIDFAASGLADAPFRDWVVGVLETARYDSYSHLFGSLLMQVMHDAGAAITMIDPMATRSLAAPVIARAVERWGDLERAFQTGADRLGTSGFTAPLNRLGLFQIGGAGRTAVDDPARCSPEDVLAHPERYSPGAALRPVVQDAMLPTIATVAGPTELLYLWQIDPLYQIMDVSRSAIWPRLSATFVDHRTRRRARKFNLTDEAILNVLSELEQVGASPDPADDRAVARIEQLGDELVRHIDTLAAESDQHRKPLGKARESIQYQVQRVVERVRQQRLEQAGVGKRNLQNIADVIYPGGGLQERSFSTIEMLGRHGPAWVRGLLELDPTVLQHHLIDIAAPAA